MQKALPIEGGNAIVRALGPAQSSRPGAAIVPPARGESMAARHEYVSLNAMRGVAALGVVLYHGFALFGTLMPRGYLAVDLFFVLSGFVIAHAYAGRLTRGMPWRSFMLARLIRFYPLYAAGLALGAVREVLLLATGNDFGMSPEVLLMALAAAALFLPFPIEQRSYDLFPVNVPSWSLFFELLVNALYALVLPVLSIAVLVGAILISGLTLAWLAPAEGLGHVGVNATSFAGGCARTIFSFAIGLLIHRVQPRAPRLPMPVLLVATALAMANPWGGAAYDWFFIVVLSPALVVLGAGTEPSRLLAGVAAFLGVISFPIYALHRPVLALAEAIANKAHIAPLLVGIPVLVGLVIVCGTLAPVLDAKARSTLTRLTHARLRRDAAETAAP